MDSRNVVDVSCFLLFEASGDSEVDSDPFMAVAAGHHHNALAVADAESCSCDLSDYVGVNGFKDRDVRKDYDGDDEDNEGEKEVNSYDLKEKKRHLPNFASKRDKKSRACVDKSREVMNETEKNRLFWETCLAS